MATIPIGTTREDQIQVTGEMAINFLPTEGARVLSTPQMILFMERACRTTLTPLLDPGYDSLGTHVDVWHLAAAPMGATVTIRAEIVGVTERRVQFRVEAWNGKEKIGEGTHERAIVNVARFAARMAEKKA